MLEYIHEEIQIEEITVKELKVDATVPNSKEMITLENRLIKLEKDLREEISNYHLLQNSYCELIDFLNVLNKNKEFFDPVSLIDFYQSNSDTLDYTRHHREGNQLYPEDFPGDSVTFR